MGSFGPMGYVCLGSSWSLPASRVSSFFEPGLNGLHWAFWSPLQAVFLVVMVAVIIAAQHYLPAVPWTHFDWSKR
ncbi:hypothetical protein [Pseudomonas gelidaquae]|uniref:hypothetical protein n=1 Tax=Pseudomonas sp. IB20 TaxID=1702250 RepID=UPI0012D2C0C1|nr:hypothetical protein [Pseudomonas sp. IB20]